MRILIIGGGGREHALSWKAANSDQVEHVYVAPGNAGTALEPKTSNVNIASTQTAQLIQFAKEHKIDLTIVGPEIPLSLGIVDQFQKHHLKCFGPSQKAAQLESSKAFCKEFMIKYDIPTANYQSFTQLELALDYVLSHSYPLVIKADGLAAGKGVIIAENHKQAEQTVIDMLQKNKYGQASNTIVIEEFLIGIELSFIAMVDGQHILPLASSQDHKKLLNNDQGPNTGGMGAFSPSPLLTAELEQRILTTVMQPTVDALASLGTPYVGFLYAGLMISPTGDINVLEFNCRLGDPETQPIMMRLQSDLPDLCIKALQGKLDTLTLNWDPRPALTVVMCSQGYPGSYTTGYLIDGLTATTTSNVKVFHAGTTCKHNEVVTAGGRVLNVTALGANIEQAHQAAYQQINDIAFEGACYRTDIGLDTATTT